MLPRRTRPNSTRVTEKGRHKECEAGQDVGVTPKEDAWRRNRQMRLRVRGVVQQVRDMLRLVPVHNRADRAGSL